MRITMIFLAFGLSACDVPPTKVENEIVNDNQKNLPPNNRYEIVLLPGTTQSILLDTATGQTWYRVSSGASDTNDVTSWLPMDKETFENWGRINNTQQ